VTVLKVRATVATGHERKWRKWLNDADDPSLPWAAEKFRIATRPWNPVSLIEISWSDGLD
jgi:hypothetical protein